MCSARRRTDLSRGHERHTDWGLNDAMQSGPSRWAGLGKEWHLHLKELEAGRPLQINKTFLNNVTASLSPLRRQSRRHIGLEVWRQVVVVVLAIALVRLTQYRTSW